MDDATAWRVRRVVLSVLFLLVVAVPLYPELFGLDEVTPFPQLVAFRPQGLVVVLVVALVMLLREGWRIAAGLVLLLAVTGAGLTAPRALSDPEPPPAGTRELTVMVANVLGGGAEPGEVAKLIRDRRPDVVSLPEAQVDVRQQIEAELRGLGYNGYTQQANTAVESATSVLVSSTLGGVRFDSEKLDPSRLSQPSTKPGAGEPGAETIGPVQQTTTRFGHVIITGGSLGKLRLIAYHGYPPLPDAVPSWKQDLHVLRKWCAEDRPTIVAGDFNATTDHADFRDALGSRCRSVAPAVGAGLRGTWPSSRPAVLRTQIDHVVVSDGVAPGKFRTYEIGGTDHLAVVATVVVPKES
ncbi:endonuclease/exonuclease/phosphatase (EEP) superfamily protein YafD [Kribbella amoyensis]|uniref:Endonuclease/exonuclease/phosphatase (EEP) superfamily protein YafD n=1 Tax=Kribbella amoyensis TaxID=996641 RepID=A0A561B805_9ACTN|nr:endonuclease/exonuclease/phosphatase family protein [Kribbella amoyensis]TWD74939.1 endonuclease/exonuclease/phosphatase (EEP) superfamily protein YafD [Kribbella amoyensis]